MEDKSSQPLGCVGLRNLRNTCYMNSVIQSLSQCRDFNKFFQSVNKETLSDDRLECRLAKYMKILLDAIWFEKFSVITPLSFHNCLCVIYPDFGNGKHQDCQEFLRVLLDNLHEAFRYENTDSSPISDMFRVTVQNEILCAECRAEVKNQEEFYEIPLIIPEDDSVLLYNPTSQALLESQDAEFYSQLSTTSWNKLKGIFSKSAGLVVNLYDCLLEFTKQEFVNDQTNLRECGVCFNHTSYYRRSVFASLPRNLIFMLKRFKYGLWGSKIDTYVNFPKVLQIPKQFLADDTDSEKYELFAVVQHSGFLWRGHYVAYCLARNGKWMLFNDGKVKEVSEETVREAQAYLLFYRKVID